MNGSFRMAKFKVSTYKCSFILIRERRAGREVKKVRYRTDKKEYPLTGRVALHLNDALGLLAGLSRIEGPHTDSNLH